MVRRSAAASKSTSSDQAAYNQSWNSKLPTSKSVVAELDQSFTPEELKTLQEHMAQMTKKSNSGLTGYKVELFRVTAEFREASNRRVRKIWMDRLFSQVLTEKRVRQLTFNLRGVEEAAETRDVSRSPTGRSTASSSGGTRATSVTKGLTKGLPIAAALHFKALTLMSDPEPVSWAPPGLKHASAAGSFGAVTFCTPPEYDNIPVALKGFKKFKQLSFL